MRVRKKTVALEIMLEPSEKAIVKQAAAQHKMSLSAWARAILLPAARDATANMVSKESK